MAFLQLLLKIGRSYVRRRFGCGADTFGTGKDSLGRVLQRDFAWIWKEKLFELLFDSVFFPFALCFSVRWLSVCFTIC